MVSRAEADEASYNLDTFIVAALKSESRDLPHLTFLRQYALKMPNFEKGPNLYLFGSRTDFASRSCSRLDLRPRIESNLGFELEKNTSAVLRYRFADPSGHDIHLFSLGVNLKI